MSLKNAFCLSIYLRILVVIVGMGLVFFKCVKSENQAVALDIPPMLEAAASGNYDKIEKLLKDGVSSNVVDDAGSSKYSLVGSTPSYLMNVGNSALAFAVWNGTYPANQKCIDLLLQHQADVRLVNKSGQPPFFWVLKIDYKDLRMQILGKLIKFGADINMKDFKSYTILEKIVETYDTAGIDIFLDWWGRLVNPEVLHAAKERAVQYNLTDVLAVLNKKRAVAPSQVVDWDPSALEKRMNLRDDIEVYDPKAALEVKAVDWNPSLIDKRMGLNSLHFAVIGNDKSLLDACLDRGASANKSSEDEYGMRPLHYAVVHYNPDLVGYLLSKKANVNATDLYSNTPLHMIAWLNNVTLAKQIADILLKNGANINARNKDGNTLLHTLVYSNNKDLIGVLGRDYTFDLYAKNNDRESVIDLAKRLDREILLNMLKK